jgi:hypothetical protein
MRRVSLPRHAPSALVCACVCALFSIAAASAGPAEPTLVTASSGLPANGASPAGTMTFTDPAGDSQGGPDVTTVTITGDEASGTIRVTVNAPGYLPTSSDGLERDVGLWLDTDRNRLTGDPQDGTEYGLEAWNDSTGRYWNVQRWNGSKFEFVPQSATMSFTRSGDVLNWTLNASDLGGAKSFKFYVLAGIWSTTADDWTARDLAPDGDGWWEYSSTGTTPTPPPAAPAAKVALKIAAPTTSPSQPVAGKRFTVSFRVEFWTEKPFTSIDIATGETKTGTMTTWTPVPSGKMVSDASVAGKAIAHSESFKGGQARLSFVIPKTAKGKLLSVRVKITATEKESGKTMTARKIATFRVR